MKQVYKKKPEYLDVMFVADDFTKPKTLRDVSSPICLH